MSPVPLISRSFSDNLKPSKFSKPLAKIKKGRVLIVQKCLDNWCKIKTGKFDGWIKKKDIWGQIN